MQKKNFEQISALANMLEARRKYEQAMSNFNNADPDFFEIANQELTLAEEQLEISVKKLYKICGM